MKQKLAAGLGLALSLTTGICSAEFLGASQEVNTQVPFTLTLSNLSSDPGKYYTVACHVINTHATKQLNLNVTLANGTYSPLVYDGKAIKKDAIGKGFSVTLDSNDDDKMLIIQKIHAAAGMGESCHSETVAGEPIMIDETKPVMHFPWWGFGKFGGYVVDEPTGNKIVDTSKTPAMVTKKVCQPITTDDTLTFTATTNNNKDMGAGFRISCELNKDFLASAIAADAAADAAAKEAAPIADTAAPEVTPEVSSDVTPAAEAPTSVEASIG